MIREQTQRTAGTGPNRAEEIYEKCLKRDPLTANRPPCRSWLSRLTACAVP